MKKLLLVLAVSLAVMGCDEYYFVSGILSPGFKSATGADRALLVRNETEENLVAFHGTADVKNLIGGVRAGQTAHYFSKSKKDNPNADVFNETHDFPLVLVRHEDYKANLTDLSQAPIFTTIYVAYNANADVSTYTYTISKSLGGSGSLIVNNFTEMNAELRLNGPNGVPVGYIPAKHTETTLYLGSGNYNLYIVLRRYSPKLKETITYYPVDKQGDPEVFSFSLNDEELVFDLTKDMFDPTDITYDFQYAYLEVTNNFDNGIEVRNGSSILYQSQLGAKLINYGQTYAFQMEMPKAGTSYASTAKFGALKVVSGFKILDLPPVEMQAGYVYSIAVKNDGNDKLVVDGDGTYQVREINLGDIFQEE